MTGYSKYMNIGHRLRPPIADTIYDATKPYYQNELARWFSMMGTVGDSFRTIIIMELKHEPI
jgi:hypothetical protein